MKKFIILLVLAISLVNCKAQSPIPSISGWFHLTPPVYQNDTIVRNHTSCNFLTFTIVTVNNSVIFSDYSGFAYDTIQFVSINADYDGDGYGGFELRTSGSGTLITLPHEISINGFLSSTNYPDFSIKYYNRLLGYYYLCDNSPQQCGLTFRIKDINGLWGENKTTVVSFTY